MLSWLLATPEEAAVTSEAPRASDFIGRGHALLNALNWPPATENEAAKVIGVTSCYSGEGVTTLASAMVLAAAQTPKRRALLVDGNVSRPNASRIFASRVDEGTSDSRDLSCLSSGVQVTREPNVFLLPADCRAGERELGEHMASNLPRWKYDFDLIVVDLPPRHDASSADLILQYIDAAILVVEDGRVSPEAAMQAKRQLASRAVAVLGVAMNKRNLYIPEWLYQTL